MAMRDFMDAVTESSTVRRVFGDPIERDGVLVIPVANLRGGWGGGEAKSGVEADQADKADKAESAYSSGGGGAWSATPAGTYVLKNGDVTWVPAVDANRSIVLGCLTGIVAMLVARSIVRTIVKRS
jgi:uncharacterized spore protein YtfJ